MTEHALLEVLGPIRDETLQLFKGGVPDSPHAPKKVVAAASFSGLNFGLSPLRAQIIDFGIAFFANNPPPSLGCPIEFFPVELLFQYPASDKSDVWQLAALMFYTYTERYVFFPGFSVFALLVADIVKFHGPLPDHWRTKFD